jgi:hypothetical protein
MPRAEAYFTVPNARGEQLWSQLLHGARSVNAACETYLKAPTKANLNALGNAAVSNEYDSLMAFFNWFNQQPVPAPLTSPRPLYPRLAPGKHSRRSVFWSAFSTIPWLDVPGKQTATFLKDKPQGPSPLGCSARLVWWHARSRSRWTSFTPNGPRQCGSATKGSWPGSAAQGRIRVSPNARTWPDKRRAPSPDPISEPQLG